MKIKRNKLTFKCDVIFGKNCRWNAKYREAIKNNAEKMCADVFGELMQEAKLTGEDAVRYFEDIDAAFVVRYELAAIDE